MRLFVFFIRLLSVIVLGYVTLSYLVPEYGTPLWGKGGFDTIAAPARFTKDEVSGLQMHRPATYDYSPSAEITAAATLYESGMWPVRRSWYELSPGKDKPEALVVLLHGAGRNGLSVLEMWADTAARHDLALVAPNALGMTWAMNSSDAIFIASVTEAAAIRHDIAPENIFLFGHSDGAAMAQWALNRNIGPWRAAAVHAGFLPKTDLHPSHRATPFRLYLGDDDTAFPVGGAEKNGQAMADYGHPSELLIIRGHDHWLYEVGPQIAEHAWAWFAGRGR